jgi:hypothetical protein
MEIKVKLGKGHGYKDVPKSLEASQEFKVNIIWNQQLQTANPRNKQDVIISDNDKGGCMLINAALSRDKNVIKKKPRIL